MATVNSRAKGARTELAARDILRKHTGLKWERVPGSGALGVQHQMKGDLYVPTENMLYCIEVKGYKEDTLTSSVLTSKNAQLKQFWDQAVRQGVQVNQKPLLIFKHDRSKFFVMIDTPDFVPLDSGPEYIFISEYYSCVLILEEWLSFYKPNFIKT